MSSKNGSAGNPAGKRMANPKRIARRAESWQRNQVRKIVNTEKNAERAAYNRELRAEGLPTPHEQQRAKRKEVRDQLRLIGLLPEIGLSRGRISTPSRKKKYQKEAGEKA